MATKRWIRGDYFQVSMPEGAEPFADLLERVHRLAAPAKTKVVYGHPVRLDEYGTWPERRVIEGQVTRIRMDEEAIKAGINGGKEPIDLEETEGLAGENAFLFDPRTNIVLLQRNRGGCGRKMFERYFGELLDDEDPVGIDLLPVLDETATEKLGRIRTFRSVEMRLASPVVPETATVENHGVKGVMDLQEFFRAPKFAMEVSMGREEGGLVAGAVRSVVKFFQRFVPKGDDPGQVSTLRVHGMTEGDDPLAVDLVEERLFDERQQDLQARGISYTRRRNLLRDFFDARRTFLRHHYAADGEQ